MIAAALKLAGLLLERVIGVANEILSGRNFNVIVVGIKLFETSVAIRMIASHAIVTLESQTAFACAFGERLVALVVAANDLVDPS